MLTDWGECLRVKRRILPERIGKAFDSVNPRLTKVFLPWILKNPRYLTGASLLLKAFNESEETRKTLLERDNLMVPPIMILSITNQCNLSCTGCFAKTLRNSGDNTLKKQAMDFGCWESVINQGRDLGVYTFLIAGGEPFMFPELLDICAGNRDRIFVIFTNGTAIDEAQLEKLKRTNNTAVIVSVEGGKELTDDRRGTGVFDCAIATMERLHKNGIVGGISVTITRRNFGFWMEEENIDYFIERGAKLGFFTEYIPTVEVGDTAISRSPMGDLNIESSSEQTTILTDCERREFREKILRYKDEKSLFIIHSPGDEELFGGCVSSGKGFIHVNPYGDLTPCPVSDIATHNLRHDSLRNGLQSPLFREIRDSEGLLEGGDGPCALFAHQDELEELRKKVGAYRTGL